MKAAAHGGWGWGVSCAFWAMLLWGPTNPPTRAQEPSRQPEPPVFRATTTVIQFTVVAQDADGHPVTDLKKEEIPIFEDDRGREIAFLQFEGAAKTTDRPESLPQGLFTNRPEFTAGPPRNVTAVVLIVRDLLTGRYGVLDVLVKQIPRA